MMRPPTFRGLVLCLALTAGGSLATGRLVAAYGPEPPRAAWPDDEALRPLLREAAEAVLAVEDESLAASRAEALASLGDAQERVGDVEGARSSREAAGMSPSRIRIRRVRAWASGLAPRQDPGEAERDFGQIVPMATDGKSPDATPKPCKPSEVVDIGVLLAQRLGEAGDPEAALRVLARAKEAVVLDAGYRTALLVASQQVRFGDAAAARATLDIARRRIEEQADVNRRLEGRADMISALRTLGDEEAARVLLRETEGVIRALPEEGNARSDGMNRLPKMFATVDDFATAFRLLVTDVEAIRRHSLFHDLVLLISLRAGGYPFISEPWNYPPLRREDALSALRLASEIAKAFPDERSKFGGLAAVAEAQARLGDLEGSRASYDAFPARDGDGREAHARLTILTERAQAARRAGDRAAADAELAAALAFAESLPREVRRVGLAIQWPDHPRDDAIGLVASARARMGDVDGMLADLRRIDEPSARSRVLAEAAKVRLAAGDPDDATRLALAPDHGSPSIEALERIADSRRRAGAAAGSEEALRIALREAEDVLEHRPQDLSIRPYLPNRRESPWDSRPPSRRALETGRHAAAAIAVVRLRSKLGDVAGAFRAVEQIPEAGWRRPFRSDVLPDALTWQFHRGDARGAFDRAIRIEAAEERLNSVAALCYLISSHIEPPARRPAGG
ncbi:hypothetical protein [Paludisphaera soli]|uniref:hypothetical protein n=1 Tax=Paludisphaera soli TaxID=2712865 RepID=UPI0013EA08D3|nr:hypothetical protein [Paludisphaera soli]